MEGRTNFNLIKYLFNMSNLYLVFIFLVSYDIKHTWKILLM